MWVSFNLTPTLTKGELNLLKGHNEVLDFFYCNEAASLNCPPLRMYDDVRSITSYHYTNTMQIPSSHLFSVFASRPHWKIAPQTVGLGGVWGNIPALPPSRLTSCPWLRQAQRHLTQAPSLGHQETVAKPVSLQKCFWKTL